MTRRMRPRRVLASFVLALALVGHARRAQAQSALAEELFREGRKLLKEGNVPEACAKLAESQRIEPAWGTLFNLAQCHAKEGKLATALGELQAARSLAKADGRAPRVKQAEAEIAALEPKVPRLTIMVANEPPGLAVKVAGQAIGRAIWGIPAPFDPGEHVVEASAPGKKRWSQTIKLAPGERQTISVPALEDEAPPPVVAPPPAASSAPPAVSSAPPPPPPPPPPPAERAPAPGESLSHTGQLGGALRFEMDGKARGGAAAVAASYGVGSVFEPSVGGTFGPHQGAFVRGTFYLLSGMAKPALLLGVPLFFVDGVRAGMSGGAGLQIDFSRLLGGFVQAGVEWYPAPPSGYEKVQFVPAVGVQGRL